MQHEESGSPCFGDFLSAEDGEDTSSLLVKKTDHTSTKTSQRKQGK